MGTCEEFSYGGCEGTANNFEMLAECHKTCGRTECPDKKDENVYYISRKPEKYDKKSMDKIKAKCEKKGWETFSDHCGCGCKSPCSFKPGVVGPFEAAIPRYTYYEDTDMCKQFTYGGCQGNPNNFEMLEECEECCVKDPCMLPIDPGPCRGSFRRYGYNSETSMCEPFIYGGCQGNDNNFETLKECEKTCVFDCPKKERGKLYYVSEDPEHCATIRYICKEGWVPFGDPKCGCGCRLP